MAQMTTNGTIAHMESGSLKEPPTLSSGFQFCSQPIYSSHSHWSDIFKIQMRSFYSNPTLLPLHDLPSPLIMKLKLLCLTMLRHNPCLPFYFIFPNVPLPFLSPLLSLHLVFKSE